MSSTRDQVFEVFQDGASGKVSGAIGVGGLSFPGWVGFINGDIFSSFVIVIGLIVSISIVGVNVMTWRLRSAELKSQKAINDHGVRTYDKAGSGNEEK